MIHTTMQMMPYAQRMRLLAAINRGDVTAPDGVDMTLRGHMQASVFTVAAWTRGGCQIYDCAPVVGAALERSVPGGEAALAGRGTDAHARWLRHLHDTASAWAGMIGISAPADDCMVLSMRHEPVMLPGFMDTSMLDLSVSCTPLPATTTVRVLAETRAALPRTVSMIGALVVRWGGGLRAWPGAICAVDIEGVRLRGRRWWGRVIVTADGACCLLNAAGDVVGDTHGLARLVGLLALTLCIGLHSEAITYYTPKRRKGQKRRGRGGKGRTTVRTCTLDMERWRRQERRADLKLVSAKRRSPPGHIPAEYTGASYHVGRFTRGTWVREERVLPGEEWLDIKESKRGGLLVKVARECNADGYTVGTPTPKLVLVQPA